MMVNPLIPTAALMLCVTAASAIAAPGTVLRDEKLYSQPSATSAVAGSAAKGASVDILAKQGGWLRVTAGKSTGWIRLLSVRAGAGGLGGIGVTDVVGAATTKSDPSKVVAVAGLRGIKDEDAKPAKAGLSDEDLKQARFNADELARLDAMNVATSQARSFAAQGGLAAVSVPALPEPKPAQASSPWETN